MNFDKLNGLLEESQPKIDHAKVLNPEQLEAVETTEGPVLIIAGAGSGKTKTLTHRLAKLIENGVSPDRILLLTFTNKAANEMISRAKNMLDERCSKVVACTYHSFCALILRRYAGLIGFDSNFVIHDSGDTVDTINLVKTNLGYSKEKSFPKAKELANMFSVHVNKGFELDEIVDFDYPNYEDYIKEIHKIYNAYIEYKKEHNIFDYDDLLLQTDNLLEQFEDVRKTLSNRFEYIMVDEYQDSNFLQLQLLIHLRSFDNKNICVVGDDQQCLPEGTKILTVDGYKNVEDITEDDELIVASGHGKTYFSKPESIFNKRYIGEMINIETATGKKLSATPEHVIFAKKEGTKPKCKVRLSIFGASYLNNSYYNGYQHMLNYNGQQILSYNQNQLNSIINNVSGMVIREAILDEDNNAYEFTPFNELQPGMDICIYDNNEIVKDTITKVTSTQYTGYVYDINIALYRNYISENIVVHNCIYGFRGSEFKNIINFPKQFSPCKLVILDTNYRSNQEILDLANGVIENAEEKYDKELKGLRHKGEKPYLVITDDNYSESKYILNKIIEYMQDGVSLNDIAVLIRGSNDSNELEGLIANISQKLKVPYQKFGGIKFLERAFVKDILAYVKIIVNPKDEISWFRIFQLYPGIGPIYARKLTQGIIENGIDELINEKHTKKKYGKFLPNLYNAVKDLENKEFSEQIDLIINTYYKKTRQNTIDEMSTSDANRKTETALLKDEIKEAQLLIELANGYKSASKFITDMTLEAKQKEDTTEQLTISTIHSAKGLEFKVVFIMDCVEGTFPWVKKPKSNTRQAIINNKNEQEEERRVFYVAVTRAKDDLYLMCPQISKKYGQYNTNEMSRFLTENDNYKKYTTIIK